MLKVYRVKYCVSINGGEWREVKEGLNYHYVLRDECEPTDQYLLPSTMTFQEFYEYIKSKPLHGVNRGKSIFGKPYIRVMHDWSWDSWECYYKFNTISYRRVFEERTNITLSEIFKHFPADQVIQYLKERGITTCPMNF